MSEHSIQVTYQGNRSVADCSCGWSCSQRGMVNHGGFVHAVAAEHLERTRELTETQTNLVRSTAIGVEFASELASMRILLKKYRDKHHSCHYPEIYTCPLCTEADLLLQGEVKK